MTSTIATQKLVKISLVVSTGFLIFQLIIGLLANSQAILADGISTLIGTIVACFNLALLSFIGKRNTKKYPFGKETLEPFIGIANQILMFIIAVTIIIDNVQVIIAGGNDEVHITAVILFGVLSTVFNFFGYRYFKKQAKRYPTPTAKVLVVGWQFSTIVGIGLVVGFSASWILNMTTVSPFTVYIDPALAIMLMLIFAISPITEMKKCFMELMQAVPSEETVNIITQKVEEVNQEYDFIEKIMRLGKVGGKIIIEIDYVIDKDSRLNCVSEQDKLRISLTQTFAELDYGKWVNINFTGDIILTEHIS
ncbi:MAG: cation diffusion facilitator family transporter [Defluviitaleaceae bacterium]|nr:cation diffusion facilitator family transporter [Defluviitaleaceae bacterium]